MVRSLVSAFILLLAVIISAPPASAAEPNGSSTETTAASLVAKYAWVRSGNEGTVTPWPVVPVAACSAECCCQVFEGGNVTHQCRSRDDCINAGGICRPNSDAKCK